MINCVKVCETCGSDYKAHSRAQRYCSRKCYKKVTPSPKTIDGRSTHPLYTCWDNMVRRCTNPKHPQFTDYGGRGITVHEEWVAKPLSFYAYMDEVVGPRPPTYSLDRIDNDGNYEPGNVRWASKLEQHRNRRPYMCDPNRSTRPLRLTRIGDYSWRIAEAPARKKPKP